MAEIHPFRGVHYNKEAVGDISNVICPPYDIISVQMDEELHNRSPYNFIRIEYNRQTAKDSENNNRYTRSSATFKQWLDQNILVTDNLAAIYVHDQYFHHNGIEFKRRSLILRVRLEEWEKNIIRPHENTFKGPKKDRISLLRALGANTSGVMSMYEDKDGTIASLLNNYKIENLLISTHEVDNERHDVRAITEPKIVRELCDLFKDKTLYIADGHHRYESALTYKKERASCVGEAYADAAYNFVMMALLDMDDPNLFIFPTHRMLNGIPQGVLSELEGKLEFYFDMDDYLLGRPDLWKKINTLEKDESKLRLFLVGLHTGELSVLTLKDSDAPGKLMPSGHSEIYKKMDVSIVDHVILENMLGIMSDDEVKISYTHNRQEATDKVVRGDCQLALIMSPVKSKTIKDIADASDRMPRKSTYFYPKLPSGLIVNNLV